MQLHHDDEDHKDALRAATTKIDICPAMSIDDDGVEQAEQMPIAGGPLPRSFDTYTRGQSSGGGLFSLLSLFRSLGRPPAERCKYI